MEVFGNKFGIQIGRSAPRHYTEDELLAIINQGYNEEESEEEEESEAGEVSVDDIDVASLSISDKLELIKDIFDSIEDEEEAADFSDKVKNICDEFAGESDE